MESNRLLSDNYIKINHIASKCMRLFAILILLYWVFTYIGGQCNIVLLCSCMGVCCILTLIPTIFIDLLKNNEGKCIKYVVIALAVLICSILNTTLSYTAMIVWIFPMLVASLYYNKTMVLYTALLSTVGVFAADIVNYRLCDLVIPPAHDDFADNMILVIAPCVIAIFIMSFVSYFIVSRNSTMLNNVIDHAEEVKTNQKELIYAFAELSESKSKSTGEHIKRVAKYMEVLGKASGFDDDYSTHTCDTRSCTTATPTHSDATVSNTTFPVGSTEPKYKNKTDSAARHPPSATVFALMPIPPSAAGNQIAAHTFTAAVSANQISAAAARRRAVGSLSSFSHL